jgi:crossover junction endodeoxyribonuclease RuvC
MSADTTVTLLGLDPGYDRLGWAVGSWTGRQWLSLDYGCLMTDPTAPIFDRYQQLLKDFEQLLAELQPTVAGIETLFFSKNQTTALRVSESRGLLIGALLAAKPTPIAPTKILEINPNQIKQAVTGFGSADKAAVAKMVKLELQLGDQPIIDDAMDALSILITTKTLYVSPHHRTTSITQ